MIIHFPPQHLKFFNSIIIKYRSTTYLIEMLFICFFHNSLIWSYVCIRLIITFSIRIISLYIIN